MVREQNQNRKWRSTAEPDRIEQGFRKHNRDLIEGKVSWKLE